MRHGAAAADVSIDLFDQEASPGRPPHQRADEAEDVAQQHKRGEAQEIPEPAPEPPPAQGAVGGALVPTAKIGSFRHGCVGQPAHVSCDAMRSRFITTLSGATWAYSPMSAP
jgi:hypothetical protein